MSRIGKAPIPVPSGVTVVIKNNEVKVKGPKGELVRTFRPEIGIVMTNNIIEVKRVDESRMARALHGLSRTLLANMVTGVSTGFERNLEILGVGYKAAVEGKKLIMQLGYSHPVEIEPGKDLAVAVTANTKITVSGIDKQAVGELSALIRSKRPPEVYKGKGVKYAGEYIRRKVGKAAGKKK